MGLLTKLLGFETDETNWMKVKASDKVYPLDSFSKLRYDTGSGKIAAGWLNRGYDEYAYKQFCPYNCLISVQLNSSQRGTVDMEAVQNFFLYQIRSVSIAHLVARIVTDKGMDLEIYLETKTPVIHLLETMKLEPALFASFHFEINKDPRWTAIAGLMK